MDTSKKDGKKNQKKDVNPVTGDKLKSKQTNDQYRSGWDRIFGTKQRS